MKEEVKPGVYKEKEVKVYLKKLIIISLLTIILLTYFGIKLYTKKSMEEELHNSGILYLEKYSSILPVNEGECIEISVYEMISKGIIENAKKYVKCNKDETKVKVCKLKNGKYHYTPIVKCDGENNTQFGKFKVGNEADLLNGNTDIKFLYLPLVNTNRIKSFYPENESNEYYVKAPNETFKYRMQDGKTVYKWYKKDNGTNYWNNGSYISEKPTGYDQKGEEGSPVTKISFEKPKEKSYRTIKNVKLYRTKKIEIARVHSYVCKDVKLKGTITSTTQCENRSSDTYKITIGKYYTCNGSDKVVQNTICSNQGWSDYTTTACTKSASLDCESKNGFLYTDKVWKWYVSGDFRKYYPSGNASSEEENTYYSNIPMEGYIKDEKTKKTGYKYFKLLDETNETYSLIQISDDYLELNDLYKEFNDFGFKVNKLNDIKTNKNTDYYTKLLVRNRKIGD